MIDEREWLVTDGLGGYAMGCADGLRTRRYHSLLLVAMPNDERRYQLVSGLDAWLELDGSGERIALSSQRYQPAVIAPDGRDRLTKFVSEPWPTWTYAIDERLSIMLELFAPRGRAATVLRWRLLSEQRVGARLHVRLFLAGRDWHALHHENGAFRFEPERAGDQIWRWTPYAGVPPIVVHANADYSHDPQWYRQFLYSQERERGLDYLEDLASPGVFSWRLGESAPDADLLLSTSEQLLGYHAPGDLSATCAALRASELARVAAFKGRLHRSASEYVVRRGDRQTIIAGYPWFTDWGRDTFIALRGLCLATGRLEQAGQILSSWCEHQTDGMLPNTFPSGASEPQYNSVDASLWFIIAAQEFLREAARRGYWVERDLQERLTDACEAVLHAYARGTRYGIRMDREDSLLAAGIPAGTGPPLALTWQDAIVNGRAVTPRVGKPVEVQALWINALLFGARWSERWGEIADRARRCFADRFWNAKRGCLLDVVDVDHRRGVIDERVRANQIFACGGLPVALLEGERLRSVVEIVEQALWTPMGLRTLARDDRAYYGNCAGTAALRDGSYHQGTVWPWLTFAFLEGWVRAHGGSRESWQEARRRFLPALARHVDEAGIGHVSEIADGDSPHAPRGCPFQAWSVGEIIRAFGV